MKHTFLIILLVSTQLLTSSCEKKDPNPEKSDAIYKDLSEELDIATKSLEEEEKNLISLLKDKEKVVPQTGQIKYALKKIYDSEAKIDALKQQKNFFEIKLELRKAEAQHKYEESLKEGGAPWPDEKEVAEYKAIMQIQRNKMLWDKTRGVKKYVPRGTGLTSSTDQTGAAGALAPPPAH